MLLLCIHDSNHSRSLMFQYPFRKSEKGRERKENQILLKLDNKSCRDIIQNYSESFVSAINIFVSVVDVKL